MVLKGSRVRLQDIAEQLSVSVGTVSMALQNKPAVNPATRLAVRRAARRMGYMRRRGPLVDSPGLQDLGFVICDPDSRRYSDPLHEPMMRVLMRDAPGLGVRVQFVGVPSDAECEETRRTLTAFAEGLDGLLVCGHVHAPMVQLLAELGLPFVILGSTSVEPGNPHWPGLQRVTSDVVEMGRTATRYLLGRGRRQIAILGGVVRKSLWYDLWIRGYLLAHAQAGLAPSPRLILPYQLGEGNDGWLARLAALRPAADAIVWPDVSMARVAMPLLPGHGLPIAPVDQVIAGPSHLFDDPALAGLPQIHEDTVGLTRTALQRLLLLTRQQHTPPATLCLPFTMRNLAFPDS